MASDLETYQIHLQQVEAALTADPENEDLLKLKADLAEVIKLTVDLAAEQAASAAREESSASDEGVSSVIPAQNSTWNVGDECLVQWSEDNQWYKARIDTITSNSMAAVTFIDHATTEFLNLSSLRNVNDASVLIAAGPSQNSKSQPQQQQQQQQQQQRKRPQQQQHSGPESERFKMRKKKKYDRQKMIDEAHEQDKVKWQQFNTKSKKMRGVTKKSIFATPDAANGRVGIGTCGIGGKPMTDFSHAEKRKRGS